MVVYSQIQDLIKKQYLDFKSRYGVRYVYTVVVAVCTALVLTGGYFGYQYYVQKRETRAFVGFREVTSAYKEAQQEVQGLSDQEAIDERWQDVEVLLDAVYSQNSSSYLAPYFLMYKVQIMLEKGESFEDARKEMKRALGMIPFNTPLYNLFLLKKIKMDLDSEDTAARDSALQDLKKLASSPEKYMYEEAVYTLGLYQITNGQTQDAQTTWKALAEAKEQLEGYPIESPWNKVVEDKLQSIL